MPHLHRQNGHGRFSVRLFGACAGLLWVSAPIAPVAASSSPEKPQDEPKTRQKELEEWRIACATGEGEACYALGDAYEIRKDLWGQPVKGDGLHRHDGQAHRYFRLACENDYGRGCLRLARMYQHGKGVKKSRDEAERAYGKACALMGGDACAEIDITPTIMSPPGLRS